MLRLLDLLDNLSEWTGRIVAWLTLGMVLVTCTVVALRYLFDLGWIGLQESIGYLHTIVFLAGAAFTLKHEGHVRVDIFYRRLSSRGQAWVDLFGTLVLLFPVCGFILWVSWGYVTDSWGLYEGSREPGGLPGVFLIKSLIILMPLLMLLQGAANALRAVLHLLGRVPSFPYEEELPGEAL